MKIQRSFNTFDNFQLFSIDSCSIDILNRLINAFFIYGIEIATFFHLRRLVSKKQIFSYISFRRSQINPLIGFLLNFFHELLIKDGDKEGMQ